MSIGDGLSATCAPRRKGPWSTPVDRESATVSAAAGLEPWMLGPGRPFGDAYAGPAWNPPGRRFRRPCARAERRPSPPAYRLGTAVDSAEASPGEADARL